MSDTSAAAGRVTGPDVETDRSTSTTAHEPPSGEAAGEATAAPHLEPEQGPRRRRFDKSLVVVSLVIALGMILVIRGFLVSVTGDDRAHYPDDVERVVPVPEAVQVLSQSNVFVDLEDNHTGVLVIDGTEIETVDIDEVGDIAVEPGQQVDLPPVTIYEPGNATLTFTPSDDAPIQKFDSGVHRATVIYWKLDEGRERAHSYSWTFTVV